MSFYGSVSNAGKTSLTFDVIYPNRKLMEQNCQDDGVFVGRCVLIEYDDNEFAQITGYVYSEDYIDTNNTYKIYTDRTRTKPFTVGDVSEEEGYGISIGSLVRARRVTEQGNFVDQDVYFFVCEKQESGMSKDALFRLIDQNANLEEEGVSINNVTDYALNYIIDKQYCKDKKVPFNKNGWDSTIWMKVAEQGKVKYKMIGSLNSELPSLEIRAEAPSIAPVAPHFGEEGTNMNYILHMPTMWGFKVKNVEGSNLSSDESVSYTFDSNIQVRKGKENEEGEENEEEEEDENADLDLISPDLSGEKYKGAIYYNKAGFDKFERSNSKKSNFISITPTGYSRNYPYYYNHNDADGALKTYQPDMQEIAIQLPAIGNAVSEFWDLMYGEKSDSGEYLKSRNDNIEWNDTSGIRMIHNDPDVGGFKFTPKKSESVAGAINSLHDLMGMIITKAPEENETVEEALERAASNKIYFGPLGKDGRNGFFYKDIQYEYETFDKIGDLNKKYEDLGKPLPFPGFDPEKPFSGSKTYYDLVQFEPNKYYTYADNNFYLDSNDTPTPDTPYYLLGEPEEVHLKLWTGLKGNEGVEESKPNKDEDDDKTSDLPVYYLNGNDYVNDTSSITALDKQYYTLKANYATITKELVDEEKGRPETIFIYNPTEPTDYDGSDWSEIVNGKYLAKDDEGHSQIDSIKTNGYFYLYYDENTRKEETLLKVNPEDPWKSDRVYFKVPLYAEGTRIDATGNPRQFFYFIDKSKEIIGFEDAVKRLNGVNFDYERYKINLIEFIPNKYYFGSKIEVETNDGKPREEFCYKALMDKNDIDDNVVYYTLIPTPVTGEGFVDSSEGSSEDILFTHYYIPNEYYFINDTNDYVLSTSSSFNSNRAYYKLTDKNGDLLKKKDNSNLFDIEPEDILFYEPNKYYYASLSLGENKLDLNVIMKKPEDAPNNDVDPLSFKNVNGKDLVYFIPQNAYVIEDSNDILKKGMVWDKVTDPPEGVILGGRYEIPVWTELKGFNKNYNTVNGLILQLNKYLRAGDDLTRDESTVQGCLNKIQDILNLTDNLNPNNIIVIDGYGRMVGATLYGDGSFKFGEEKIPENYSGWIMPTIENQGKHVKFNLEHTLPKVENSELTEVGGLKIDKNGHVRGLGSSMTVNSLSDEIEALEKLVGDVSVATQIDNAIKTEVIIENEDGTTTNQKMDKFALVSELTNTNARVKTLEDTVTTENVAKWNAAEANVQVDWTENNSSSDAYIQNKPNLSVYENVQSDWSVVDTTSDAYIKNKPDLSVYENVQSDWNVTDATSNAFILNKPDLSNYITNNLSYKYNGTATPMTIEGLLAHIAGLEARIKALEDAAPTPTT